MYARGGAWVVCEESQRKDRVRERERGRKKERGRGVRIGSLSCISSTCCLVRHGMLLLASEWRVVSCMH